MRVVTKYNEEDNTRTIDLEALEKQWEAEFAFKNEVYNVVSKATKYLTWAAVVGTVVMAVYVAVS